MPWGGIVTEGTKDKRREVGGAGPRPPRLVVRVAAWLIVPLYAAATCAYYFLYYSVGPRSEASVVDVVGGC